VKESLLEEGTHYFYQQSSGYYPVGKEKCGATLVINYHRQKIAPKKIGIAPQH